MRRTVILYGLGLAALTALLKAIEYQFLVRDVSMEVLLGSLAALFAGLGIWTGVRLSKKNVVVLDPNFRLNEEEMQRLGISRREHEVLQLLAQGRSNEEIGEALFVSLSTVKTHISSIFQKLNVRRRTEAVLRARESGLIP